MKLGNAIVDIADDYEKLVEVVSNAKWDNPHTKGPDAIAKEFEELLKGEGSHQDGWAYCMSYARAVWVVALKRAGASPTVIKRIKSILSPSVMNSYNAAREAGLATKIPKVGAIMFMQNGGKWTGHAGIVTAVEDGYFHTIEANTSPSDANERDGGIGTGGVWRKKRSLDFTPKKNGLWLRGFMNPFENQ
jgi:hypothetical protein